MIADDEPDEAAQRLIQMARDAGGPANMSAVIYRAPLTPELNRQRQ